MAYAAFAFAVVVGLLFSKPANEVVYDGIFAAAGYLGLAGFTPFALSLLAWLLIPLVPLLGVCFLTIRLLPWSTRWNLWVVGSLAIILANSFSYRLGQRWMQPFSSGVLRQLAGRASPTDWRQWTQTNMHLASAAWTGAPEQTPSWLVPAQGMPSFAREAYPSLRLTAFLTPSEGGSSTFLWRANGFGFGLNVDLSADGRNAVGSYEDFSRAWTNGVTIFVHPE